MQIALKNIETAGPENITKQILGLFSSISVMSGPEAIAAYQTIQFFIAQINLEQREFRRQMRSIQEAVISRMIAVMCAAPKDQRPGLVYSFEAAITSGPHVDDIMRAFVQLSRTERW